MMNLLAIDTATDQFSVALGSIALGSAASGGAVGRENTWFFEADAGLRHSELVMDIVDMLMRKAELKPENLSGVVCMGGPGSFTGLRIGFSIAKGLALSLGIPFAAIPTLDCLARPFFSWPGIVIPALDAKKGAFFCALYREGARLTPDMDAPPAEIARVIAGTHAQDQILLIGPAASTLYDQLGDMSGIKRGTGLQWGNAKTLLTIARETSLAPCDYSRGPEYIRKSDAELCSR